MIFKVEDSDRIIEMAWEDRTTFEAKRFQFQLTEQHVIDLMRCEMKYSSFKMWRKRGQGRAIKYDKLCVFENGRFKGSRQKQITHNTIAKR